jgi:hypothetical protein
MSVNMDEKDREFLMSFTKENDNLNLRISDEMRADPSTFALVINSILLDRRNLEKKYDDLMAENNNLNKVISILQEQVSGLQEYLMKEKGI